MLTYLILALLILLVALPTTRLMYWLWWNAEKEARAKVFDSSIQQKKKK